MAAGKGVAAVSVTDAVVPVLLGGTALYALLRRTDVYRALMDGAAEGLRTMGRIAPALIALLTAVYMFRACGALDWCTAALAPVLTRLGT